MRVGVDFDNTIVRYDDLFHGVALERDLIPADLPKEKSAVRDFLRAIDKEDDWTEMQGYVYGERMVTDARPFPGVREFFLRCQNESIPTCIISHKTRHPYRGEKYDLHAAARAWLDGHGFDGERFFELTKADKLARIASAGCTHFIDDLPEFLAEATFPKNVRQILFDPNDRYEVAPPMVKQVSWDGILAAILADKG
jgi:hypothetical protein